MSASDPLLNEFKAPSLQEWRAEVERLLKGAPFARKMFTGTLEGIRVGSMATAADLPETDWSHTLPGQAPFLRGARVAGPCLVAQEIPLESPSDFNAALRHDLQRGQTAVNLILDGPGARGTTIVGLEDLRAALAGVNLAEIPVLIQAGASHFTVAENLLELARETGVGGHTLQGRLGCDPVAGLAVEGSLPVSADQLYDELADISRRVAVQAPGLRTLPVFEDPWHDGGADGALGLGLTLGAAVHVLGEMEARGLSITEAADRVHFNLCVGSDFFLEISRLRALRVLWSRVLDACGADPAVAPPVVHVRTSRRTNTVLDPYVNLLRATTQAMSAVLGGADSLHVGAFDEATGRPDEFSRRIARNVPLILTHECHLDHVTDPAAGSWYVEKLTADLAARAWEHFQTVQASGGVMKALESGQVQKWVAGAAAARADRLANRREVLVGTNQYPDPHSMTTTAGLAAVAVETAIPLRRDGEPFEILRAKIEAMGQGDPAAGRVYCVCLKDMARYMPRLEFTRRFFRVGGFEISGEGFNTTATAAAAGACADGARTVVLVGLDDTYAEMADSVAAALKQADQPPVVMLAGPPVESPDIDEVINVKSDVLDVLGRLAAKVKGVS